MEITQNIILSLIKFLQSNLSGVNIGRRTPEEVVLPAVIIREGTGAYKYIELGSKQFTRKSPFYFEIFATGDGERLTIKDKLVSLLKKSDIPLYSCDLIGDEISTGNLLCYLDAGMITDYPVNLGEDISQTSLIDRHRHLVLCEFNIGKIE